MAGNARGGTAAAAPLSHVRLLAEELLLGQADGRAVR